MRYNEVLFKKNMKVRLRKDGTEFETFIKGVNEHGELLTIDSIERKFRNGGIEWV